MHKKDHHFSYTVYDSAAELAPEDEDLLKAARAVVSDAYAPYSHFRVGAVARLVNGQRVSGTNQENASYPAGICAERTLLSAAASLFPGIAIDTMAISYLNEQGTSLAPISPCGICRQSLQEFKQRTGVPIRLLLAGQEGPVYEIIDAGDLLPMAFTNDELSA